MRELIKIAERLIRISEDLLDIGRRKKMGAIPPEELKDWEELGFTSEEARDWRRVGVREPDRAKEWRDAGFAPREADRWATEIGYTANDLEAVELIKVFAVWRDAGFYPEEASEWWLADFMSEEGEVEEERKIVEEVKKWKKLGFTPEEARKWKESGFTPEQASKELEKGGEL